MIAPRKTGWQTLLVDLSLILFMLTASVLARTRATPPRLPAAATATATRPSPLAIWRADAGGPSLPAWIATQPADPRQQLTIVARYGADTGPADIARAAALLQAGATAGARARLVLEPGEGPITASFGFDPPAARLARGLLPAERPSPRESTP